MKSSLKYKLYRVDMTAAMLAVFVESLGAARKW
jgi:hypothetical protein